MDLWDTLSRLIGGGVQAPVPKSQRLDDPLNMATAKLKQRYQDAVAKTDIRQSKGFQEGLARLKQANPKYNGDISKLAALYQQYGDKLFSELPTITPTPLVKQVMVAETGPAVVDPQVDEFLNSKVLPITRKYNIPDAVAAGMFAAEGRLKGLGASRNNYFNIGAFDSNLGNTYNYNSPEDGVDAYAKFISGQGSYASPRHKILFTDAYGARNDPDKMLSLIQDAGYAGDPKTYRKRAKNGFDSYADFIKSTPEYQKYRNEQR